MIVHTCSRWYRFAAGLVSFSLLIAISAGISHAESFDLAINNHGISFGNSKNFTGLRFNFRDKNVEKVNGVNITLWNAREHKDAIINGISLGLFPRGDYLNGIQMGLLGIVADSKLRGFSTGLLVASANDGITGITIGGIGVGCAGNVTGLTVGLLFLAGGKNVKGVTFGGLIGVEAETHTGIAIGGREVEAHNIRGIALAAGTVKAVNPNDADGNLTGFSVSSYNQIRGRQTGVTLGFVNYAYTLSGFQIGIINFVRDNPRARRMLPLINWNF
jgi:hypothetical protein